MASETLVEVPIPGGCQVLVGKAAAEDMMTEGNEIIASPL